MRHVCSFETGGFQFINRVHVANERARGPTGVAKVFEAGREEKRRNRAAHRRVLSKGSDHVTGLSGIGQDRERRERDAYETQSLDAAKKEGERRSRQRERKERRKGGIQSGRRFCERHKRLQAG